MPSGLSTKKKKKTISNLLPTIKKENLIFAAKQMNTKQNVYRNTCENSILTDRLLSVTRHKSGIRFTAIYQTLIGPRFYFVCLSRSVPSLGPLSLSILFHEIYYLIGHVKYNNTACPQSAKDSGVFVT